jgi:flagellar hook-associated protein 3 FlgL
MLGRVTQRSIAHQALTNLQNSQARSAKLQEQITSGTTLSKGSDDSVRAAAALRLNEQIAVNGENTRNIADARLWNSTQEDALKGVADSLRRVRDLTVQAGNGALDAKGREAIATEIDSIKETIMGAANTQHQGRAVFAGTTNTTVAFAADYTAADNLQVFKRTVSPGVDMTVSIGGASVFGSGATSVFQELDELSGAIRSGATAGVTAGLGKIDTRISLNASAMATIGARDNQLDHAEDVNTNQLQYLTTQLEDVQGVDPAKAYLEFKQQDVAYQAALQVTAKTVQTSLLDFLR